MAKSFPTVYPTGRRPKPFFFIRQLMLLFFSSYFFQKNVLTVILHLLHANRRDSRDRDLVNLLNCSFFAVLRNNSMTSAIPCVTGRVRRFRSFPLPFYSLSPSIFLSVGKGPQSTQLLLSWNHFESSQYCDFTA